MQINIYMTAINIYAEISEKFSCYLPIMEKVSLNLSPRKKYLVCLQEGDHLLHQEGNLDE